MYCPIRKSRKTVEKTVMKRKTPSKTFRGKKGTFEVLYNNAQDFITFGN